jgi:catechol 2,3-dioxygenase-like lactoylglutathione lyase family enzyme
MTIDFGSVLVDDLEKALRFYTDVLGLVKMADIPMGEFRFLTVGSAEKPDGAQLILETTDFPPAKVYQKALFDAGKPSTSLITRDIEGDIKRLKVKGVKFRSEAKNQGPILSALFEDTCGNLVNLVQPLPMPN